MHEKLNEFSMMELLRRDISRIVARATQVPRLAARGLILVYRYSLSAFIGRTCRHLPTCSDYADEAIGRFGLWAGGWMSLARIIRCHPYGTHGVDFVPVAAATNARWYLPWRYGRWRGTRATPDVP